MKENKSTLFISFLQLILNAVSLFVFHFVPLGCNEVECKHEISQHKQRTNQHKETRLCLCSCVFCFKLKGVLHSFLFHYPFNLKQKDTTKHTNKEWCVSVLFFRSLVSFSIKFTRSFLFVLLACNLIEQKQEKEETETKHHSLLTCHSRLLVVYWWCGFINGSFTMNERREREAEWGTSETNQLIKTHPRKPTNYSLAIGIKERWNGVFICSPVPFGLISMQCNEARIRPKEQEEQNTRHYT